MQEGDGRRAQGVCGLMLILHFLEAVFYKIGGSLIPARICVSGVVCVCLMKLVFVVPFIKKYLRDVSLDPEKVTFSFTTPLR